MAASEELLREELALLERKKALLGEQLDPPTTAFASFLNNLTQGATFGFSDEIAAAITAGVKAPFSKKTAREVFDEQLAIERDNLRRASEQFPKTSIAGLVTGGVGTGGAVAKGATQLLSKVPRLPRIAAIGATEGGAFGAGTAEEERLKSAAIGAGIGAVVAPVATGAITAIGRAGKRLISPVARAAFNTPQRQAERLVQRAMELDELGPATAGQQLRQLGPQATLADLGENLSGLARAATAKTGRGRTIAANLLTSRQVGQQGRVLKAAGVPEAKEFKSLFAGVLRNRQSASTPLYQEAFSQPLQLTPKLTALLNRPSVQKSLKRAANILKDEGGQGGHVRLLNAVKQDLDDQIGKALRGGKRNEARRLLDIKRQLLEEVDAQVPAYAQARQLFAGEAALKDSANLGRSLLTRRVDLDDMEFALQAMTEGERHAFRLGAVRGMVDKLEGLPETRNAAQKLIESTRARELLNLAFPDDATFQRFIRTAEAESTFSFTRNRILGGSPTARIQEEVRDLANESSIIGAIARGGDPISTGINFLRSIGMGGVSDETLEQVAKILFRQSVPRGTLSRVAGERLLPQIPEVTRQGAIGGAVGALINQQE